MAQFDLHRHARSKRYPYLIDLQSDLLRDLASRIVAPLMPAAHLRGTPIRRLNPVAVIEGVEHVILFQELAAFPAGELGDVVDTLASRRDELVAALDLVFTGI